MMMMLRKLRLIVNIKNCYALDILSTAPPFMPTKAAIFLAPKKERENIICGQPSYKTSATLLD
jgi:hypothetical protein